MNTANDYWNLFSDEASRIGSPLYGHLSKHIATDVELRRISANAKPGQPQANLILAAVHYLLLEGRTHALSAYYPTMGGTKSVDADTFPHFKNFCLAHEPAASALVAMRVTNTNEVARSTSLYPAFDHIARETGEPLHMIEIGPSAGFNLNWDRYAYRYKRDGRIELSRGPQEALTTLEAELKGDAIPPLASQMPLVLSRRGLELNPVNLTDAADRLWLKALIFPELTHRVARLETAIATAQAHPVTIEVGDALASLPVALEGLPSTGVPVVYHSFVTYQFSTAMRQRLDDILTNAAARRPLYRVSIEWENAEHPITVTRHDQQGATSQVLGDCNPHGAWIKWRGPAIEATA